MRVVFFTLIIWLISYISSCGKNTDLLFRNISIDQGLSQNCVLDIIQDSKGYMWFATKDGLNRYDGYDFKTYRINELDSGAITSNYIRKLFIDNQGNLWVGGNNGLSRYDYLNDNFNNYLLFKPGEEQYVSGIVSDSNDNIWVSTYNGRLYTYNKQSDSFNKFNYSLSNTDLTYIDCLAYKDNKLFLGTENGLFYLTIKNKASRKAEKVFLSSSCTPIGDIQIDPIKGLWIGTEGDGLYLINRSLNTVAHYKHLKNNHSSLINNTIRKLEIDNEGALWVGTFGGLSILKEGENEFSNYQEDFDKPYSLTKNSIRALFKDNKGAMWIGTYYGGIDYYNPHMNQFYKLDQNKGNSSLGDKVISSLIEDHKGNIYIGTNDHGLDYWHVNESRISHINKDNNTPKLSSNNIKSMLLLEDNSLLIGTHAKGLNRFWPQTQKNKVFLANTSPKSLHDNHVYAITRDHSNQIWIGTWKGLLKFDASSNTFISHYIDSHGKRLSSDRIYYLFTDSRNRVWIGTVNGLNIFYPHSNTFEIFQKIPHNNSSLSSNEIKCITEDSKGRIWIGTTNGLNLFNEQSRSFIRYSQKDGLANNTIYGILEDDNQQLWISSNAGLSCFQPDDGIIINYDVNDGLQSNQFNNYSFLKTASGRLLFGGINGLTYFDPKDIKPVEINKNVLLTNLFVNNKEIFPTRDSDILLNHINTAQQIHLGPEHRTCTLKFVAINFCGSEKVEYVYKLEGLHNTWNELHSSRSVNFSNLNPGKYTFKVAVKDPIDISESDITALKIIVNPPWWKTRWAYLLYLIVTILICLILIVIIKSRMRTQNVIKLERLEKQRLLDLNQMKLQFFTNISHEFKTPLTLIISPLEKLVESKTTNQWYNKQIDLVYKNAKRLLELINQLIDFRKSEMGLLELKVLRSEVISFINDIYASFNSLAKMKDITYIFETNIDKLDAYFDKNNLDKIIFNLLSNAFKATDKGDTIRVSVYHSQTILTISINDSGRGIPRDQQLYIFDHFFTSNISNTSGDSGIGLAYTKNLVELHHGTIHFKSKVGNGTTFTVKLPTNLESYSPSEIISSQDTKFIPSDYSKLHANNLTETTKKAEAYDTNKERIIIIDDNPDITDYLRDSLSSHYNIDVAKDGKEALTKINEIQYDLIVSDVMMPNMDGVTFCKKVKQNIKTCHIPVILLSVKSSTEDQVEGLNIGADDYLGKPFSLKILETKISNLIKSRKRLKDLYSENLEIKPDTIAYNTLDQQFLIQAVKIVEKYLSDQNFSVDIFAREMYMSRSNLHLKLKAITGESASEFIKKIRLGKAVELLKTGEYSIAEISYQVGYTSPSYFSNRFKLHFNCLPTEYLKSKNAIV